MHVQHEDHRRRMCGLVGQVKADVDSHDLYSRCVQTFRYKSVSPGRFRRGAGDGNHVAEIIRCSLTSALQRTRSTPSQNSVCSPSPTSVCPLPHAPRACPPGSQLILGGGIVVGARDASANCYPHPQPLPTTRRRVGGGEHTGCVADAVQGSGQFAALAAVARSFGLLKFAARHCRRCNVERDEQHALIPGCVPALVAAYVPGRSSHAMTLLQR